MELTSLLGIPRGVTALIGGGGKTTMLYALTEELRARGSVLLCTTTKIRVPEDYETVTAADPALVRERLARRGAVCVGTPCPGGKLSASGLAVGELAALADYVLVEADGSRGLPLKAHAAWEPVIPPETGRTVLVLGADGFGRPIREVCHRPELYAALAGAPADAPVTPALAARVIAAEGFGDIVFVNKTEDAAAMRAAGELAARLPLPAAAGSLRRGEYRCLY